MSDGRSVSPSDLRPGDIVVPTRGRYAHVQCEVKRVDGPGKYATYDVIVVPVLPLAEAWSVDYGEKVKVVRDA